MASGFSAPRLGRALLHLTMVVLVILWLLPVATSLLVAFKTTKEYMSQSFWQLPETWAIFENVRAVWQKAQLGTNFFNTLLYGFVGAVGAIFLSAIAAYSLVWFRPRFGFLLFLIIWSGTIFPYQMYLIPLFRTYLALQLYDTRLGMCLFYIAIAIPFSVFVFRGAFSTIPKEIGEAAKIDGCSDLRVLFRFVLPLSKASIAVLLLFIFIWVWNDLIFGLVLTKSVGTRPVMPALAQLIGAYTGGTNYPVLMAGTIVVSLPVIVLFILLQKQFIKGLTMTTIGE